MSGLWAGCFWKPVKKILDDPDLANEAVKPFAHHAMKMIGTGLRWEPN